MPLFPLLLLASWLIAGCSSPSTTPTPSRLPVTEQPRTVEVTRVVTQEVVVTATPAPIPAPAACAPATLDQAQEIVVGVLAPISQNPVWPKALSLQAGVGLGVEQVNQAGGVRGLPVRLMIEDTNGNPAVAARMAEELITQDCAAAVIGGFLTDETVAIKQVTERYGTPFLVVEAAADELTADRPKSLFRIAPTTSMVTQMPAEWLKSVGDFNGDGTQSIYIIAENTPQITQLVDQVRQGVTAIGVTAEVLKVDTPTQDYSPQIARIVANETQPDAILIFVAGDAALDVQRQLLDAGITPAKGTLLVTGRSALDATQFWQRIPDGSYTVVSRRGPWNTSIEDVGRNFVSRYQAYSTQWPDPVAFSGYDAVQLVADAANRAGSLAPAALVAALEATNIKLASGYYEFPFNSSRPPAADEPAWLWHQWRYPPLLYLQYKEAKQDPLTIDVIWPPIYSTTEGEVLRPQP